jgi:hypothetical protein
MLHVSAENRITVSDQHLSARFDPEHYRPVQPSMIARRGRRQLARTHRHQRPEADRRSCALTRVTTSAAAASTAPARDQGRIDGYAVGVAAGVHLGVAPGSRLAVDPVEHRVAVSGDGTDLAHHLRTRDWSVTSQQAAGPDGAATVLFVVASADTTAEIERDQRRLAPHGFRTSLLRSATWTPLPVGYVCRAAPTHRERSRG